MSEDRLLGKLIVPEDGMNAILKTYAGMKIEILGSIEYDEANSRFLVLATGPYFPTHYAGGDAALVTLDDLHREKQIADRVKRESQPRKFLSVSHEIQAIQWNPAFVSVDSGFLQEARGVINKHGNFEFEGRYGRICVPIEDWIYKNIAGDFEVCRNDVFKMLHQENTITMEPGGINQARIHRDGEGLG